jgi:hypothetical protein
LAITKPFTRTLFFFTVEFWLSQSLLHELSFFSVESRLSRSRFMNFSFTWWNLSYHGVFSRFFLSHDGISAITEPFHELFFRTGGISAITEPFHGFFFHTVEYRLSRSLFTNFSFERWNSQNARFWGRLFSYISQSIYIGSASLKTLPLDLEPPLQ